MSGRPDPQPPLRLSVIMHRTSAHSYIPHASRLTSTLQEPPPPLHHPIAQRSTETETLLAKMGVGQRPRPRRDHDVDLDLRQGG